MTVHRTVGRAFRRRRWHGRVGSVLDRRRSARLRRSRPYSLLPVSSAVNVIGRWDEWLAARYRVSANSVGVSLPGAAGSTVSPSDSPALRAEGSMDADLVHRPPCERRDETVEPDGREQQ